MGPCARYSVVVRLRQKGEQRPPVRYVLIDQPNRIFKDCCKLSKSEYSFHVDAARLWNYAPTEIKNEISLQKAKKEIEKYCLSLPI